MNPRKLWALLWRSENQMDGRREYIITRRGGLPKLFLTRQQARDFIKKEFSYIRARPDLQEEPNGWRMPLAVRVTLTTEDKR